jgi:hypothetical protein
MKAHLEMEIAEYERRGMSPDEARRKALLASGGVTVAAEMPMLYWLWRVRSRRGVRATHMRGRASAVA